MGEFNSDDHYICYSGQESLKRNGRTIIVNKRVRNAILGCGFKNDSMISVRFQGKPLNIMVIQVCALTSNAEEAEVEQFCEDLQDLRNLAAGQEATVRTGHGTTDWFQVGKGVRQGCILSPCLFNLYAEYIMRNAGLEEAQAGLKIAGRNTNNLR